MRKAITKNAMFLSYLIGNLIAEFKITIKAMKALIRDFKVNIVEVTEAKIAAYDKANDFDLSKENKEKSKESKKNKVLEIRNQEQEMEQNCKCEKDYKFALKDNEIPPDVNVETSSWKPIFTEEQLPYVNAVSDFVTEIEKRDNCKHRIEKWFPVQTKNGWEDFSKLAITCKDDANVYICKVNYKDDTKDGSLRITKLETSEFVLYSTRNKGLSYKNKVKAILDALNQDKLISYSESVYNTCYQSGEKATFNAIVALEMSVDEWNSRYKNKESQKAWIEALSIHFGDEKQKALVTKGEKDACFYIELPMI